MDRQAVVVVALVFLAGCGGVSFGVGDSPETARETLTPVPVSPTGSVETPTPVERPPGVPQFGIVDARRLREAHESFVTNRSYRWTLVYDLAGPDRPSRSVRQGFRRRAVVEPDRFLVRQANDDRPLNQSLFVNQSGGYLQVVEENVTRSRTLARPGTVEEYLPSGQIIERFLTGMDPNVTRVERRGRTYYRLHDRTGLPPALERRAALIHNYSVTAYVTPKGFVRTMTVTFERSTNTGNELVSIRFYYRDVGSASVQRPAWVADLPLATPTPTSSTATATPRGESRNGAATATVAPTPAGGTDTDAGTVTRSPTPTLPTAENATGN